MAVVSLVQSITDLIAVVYGIKSLTVIIKSLQQLYSQNDRKLISNMYKHLQPDCLI